MGCSRGNASPSQGYITGTIPPSLHCLIRYYPPLHPGGERHRESGLSCPGTQHCNSGQDAISNPESSRSTVEPGRPWARHLSVRGRRALFTRWSCGGKFCIKVRLHKDLLDPFCQHEISYKRNFVFCSGKPSITVLTSFHPHSLLKAVKAGTFMCRS